MSRLRKPTAGKLGGEWERMWSRVAGTEPVACLRPASPGVS